MTTTQQASRRRSARRIGTVAALAVVASSWPAASAGAATSSAAGGVSAGLARGAGTAQAQHLTFLRTDGKPPRRGDGARSPKRPVRR